MSILSIILIGLVTGAAAGTGGLLGNLLCWGVRALFRAVFR